MVLHDIAEKHIIQCGHNHRLVEFQVAMTDLSLYTYDRSFREMLK